MKPVLAMLTVAFAAHTLAFDTAATVKAVALQMDELVTRMEAEAAKLK